MSLIPADQAGVKLQTIIKKVRRHLFVFVMILVDLTATNNGSEDAALLFHRKITNGFRSEWGAALYADIRLSSKPLADDQSAQSTQSASPSKACRSQASLDQHARGVSNYQKCG